MVSTMTKSIDATSPTSHVVIALDLAKNGTPLVIGNDRWTSQKIHLLHHALHGSVQVVTGGQGLVGDSDLATIQDRAFVDEDLVGKNVYVGDIRTNNSSIFVSLQDAQQVEKIAKAANAARIPIYINGHPELSTFEVPPATHVGDLQVYVAGHNHSVGSAQIYSRLRRYLVGNLPESALHALGNLTSLREKVSEPVVKHLAQHWSLARLASLDNEQVQSIANQAARGQAPEEVSVGHGRLLVLTDATLVDNLSVAGQRALLDVDLVIADRSVPQEILDIVHGNLVVARRHGKQVSPLVSPTILDDHVDEDDEGHELNNKILDALERGLIVLRVTASPQAALYQNGDVAFFKRHGWEPNFLPTVHCALASNKFSSSLTSGTTSVRTTPRDSPRLSPVHQNGFPVLIRPQPVVKAAVKALPERGGKLQLTNGLDAIGHVAYLASDANFIFPQPSANYLGKEVHRLNKSGVLNAKGVVGRSIALSSKTGAGNGLFGALAAGGQASALISSESLPVFIPALHEIAIAHHQGRLPQGVVVHIAAQSIDGDLHHRTDYSKVFAAAAVSGFVVLTSHTLQEAQDMALVAHVAASGGGLPILHVFDGTRIALQHAKIQALTRQQVESAVSLTLTHKAHPLQVIDGVFEDLSHIFGRRYNVVEWVGDDEATVAFVAHGNDAALVEESVHELIQRHHKVGLAKIRVLNPFDGKSLGEALPTSVARVGVLSNAREGRGLAGDVVASLRGVQVVEIKLAHDVESITNHAIRHLVHDLSAPKLRLGRTHVLQHNDVVSKEQQWSETLGRRPSLIPHDARATPSDKTKIAIWQANAIDTDNVTQNIVEMLSHQPNSVSAFTQHDALHPGVATKTEIRLAPKGPLASASIQGDADVVLVTDASVLERFNVATDVKPNGTLILNVDWDLSTVTEYLPADVKREVAHKKIQLLLVDATKISKDYTMFVGKPSDYLNLALQAVLYSHLQDKEMLLQGLRNHIEQSETSFNILRTKLAAVAKIVNLVHPVKDIPSCWLEAPQNESHLLTVVPGTISLDVDTGAEDEEAVKIEAHGLHHAAWNVMFKEAYASEEALRPDVDDTHIVTLTENRRVTPHSYDRNIMHLEMDIRGTGFKYELGDALAVYGENDPAAVDAFLHSYGIDATDIVYHQRGHHKEARTAAQLFTCNLDLFGKPGKKFYHDLSRFATDNAQRKKLALLGSADGAEEMQKRADDMVTYADTLHEFSSARPSLEELAHIVPTIKPRAYSISSSMKMHPDSVHLLVVLVSWPGKDGKERFGQCTRYLNSLKPGAKLVVSRTPSVMKLPTDDATPVIMSGLGTGMAPFRAFIEERAVRKLELNGLKQVGEMSLYFGSRHRAMEYLYGEELDAYHDDGLVTDLRLAFSRDQREKVYIQNKMEEDADRLYDLLVNKKGHFYLCGPTWPVPDVKAALIKSFVKHGWSKEDAENELEVMKEHERYVLEVY